VTSSISRQLIFWLTVPLMLLALCGALVHYFNEVAPGVISSDRRLKAAANSLMAHIDLHDGTVVLDDSNAAGGSLPPPNLIRYAVRDPQHRLILGDPQIPAVPLGTDTGQIVAMSQIGARSLRTLTTRFETGAGVVFITVADLGRPTNEAARYGFMSTLLWDFVQLDVTLVLVWVGIQLGLRPVRRLRDEIASRSPLDLRPIVDNTVPREIAPVVITLNRLFVMLRASTQSQQQFIANTAHQLRTPITGMQAQIDLLIAEPAAKPVEHRLLTLQQGVRQLARASNQLLTLARADPAVNYAARIQTIDLAALVHEVVSRYVDRAIQANIDLGAETTPAAMSADPSLLDDLLSNLVDNALKYTPSGFVTVSTGTTDGRPFLAVEDSGMGIPESEREQVKQRFYRMPNSPDHGTGLGLAIVDEVARLHDASLTISSGSNGRGTRVVVRFPSLQGSNNCSIAAHDVHRRL
jgi:two-component system sensor histidine kinase TctE